MTHPSGGGRAGGDDDEDGRRERLARVKFLLAHGCDPSVPAEEGRPPLAIAASLRHPALLAVIADALAQGKRAQPTEAAAAAGAAAATAGVLDVAEQRGREGGRGTRRTALHICCSLGDVASAHELLSRGADRWAKDQLDNTPLHSAIILVGDSVSLVEVVRVLLSNEGDDRAQPRNALFPPGGGGGGGEGGGGGIVGEGGGRGSGGGSGGGNGGGPAIAHRQARRESLVECPGEHGLRPLHFAVYRNDLHCLAFLVDHCGADVNAPIAGPSLRTPLIYALELGRDDAAIALLARGAPRAGFDNCHPGWQRPRVRAWLNEQDRRFGRIPVAAGTGAAEVHLNQFLRPRVGIGRFPLLAGALACFRAETIRDPAVASALVGLRVCVSTPVPQLEGRADAADSDSEEESTGRGHTIAAVSLEPCLGAVVGYHPCGCRGNSAHAGPRGRGGAPVLMHEVRFDSLALCGRRPAIRRISLPYGELMSAHAHYCRIADGGEENEEEEMEGNEKEIDDEEEEEAEAEAEAGYDDEENEEAEEMEDDDGQEEGTQEGEQQKKEGEEHNVEEQQHMTDNNAHANWSFTLEQQQVLSFFNQNDNQDDDGTGLSLEYVSKALIQQGISDQAIRAAVEFLSGEGHLYSTIDDNHYKPTN